jgi:hypothetical protein
VLAVGVTGVRARVVNSKVGKIPKKKKTIESLNCRKPQNSKVGEIPEKKKTKNH